MSRHNPLPARSTFLKLLPKSVGQWSNVRLNLSQVTVESKVASADRVKYLRNGSRRCKRRPEHGTTKRCLSLSISFGSRFHTRSEGLRIRADAFSRSSSRFIDIAESLLILLTRESAHQALEPLPRTHWSSLWQQGDRPHSIGSGRASLPVGCAAFSAVEARLCAWWVRLYLFRHLT